MRDTMKRFFWSGWFRTALLCLSMIGMLGCTAKIDEPDPRILFSVDRTTIETSDTVTLNVTVENAGKILSANWEADPNFGQILASGFDYAVFESTRNVGSTSVTVRFTTEDRILSGSTLLTIVYPDTVAPDTPSGVVIVPGDNHLALSWNPVSAADIGGYVVKYSMTPGAFHHVVDVGNVTEYVLTGLDNAQTYYVILTAYDTSRQRNESVPTVQFAAIPLDLGPTSPVRSLFAKSVSGGIQLSWFNPTEPDFDRVILRRSRQFIPVNPGSGTPVYEGRAESFLDTVDLQSGQTYYYSIFAMDDEGDEGNASERTSYSVFYP